MWLWLLTLIHILDTIELQGNRSNCELSLVLPSICGGIAGTVNAILDSFRVYDTSLWYDPTLPLLNWKATIHVMILGVSPVVSCPSSTTYTHENNMIRMLATLAKKNRKRKSEICLFFTSSLVLHPLHGISRDQTKHWSLLLSQRQRREVE